jgi:hypothetical protein
MDTGRTIDILQSRETDDVARWLKTYTAIEVVSRDGSPQYAAAIRRAHPDAIQVSDRFHLIKNLTECAKRHISQIVTANFRIPAKEGTQGTQGGYFEKPECHTDTLPQREHEASVKRKQATVDKVRMLSARGLSVSEAAKETGIAYQTAKKYLEEDFDPANKDYGASRASKLKPYTTTIDAMLHARRPFKKIEAVIRKDGYTGAASTIRMYATRQRKIIKAERGAATEGTELIERRWVVRLLYQPPEKVKGLTEDQITRIIQHYPVIGEMYDLIGSFKEMMFAKRAGELEAWLESAARLDITEINGFINGVLADLEAVRAAILYDYNNGLAEGSVNKLKVVKRIMYGRCSFKLLRCKLLARELIWNIN